MIILDLEWNSGCDEEKLEEILQIGAVKVDRLGGPVRDSFLINIRPRIHKQLCLNARLLPDAEECRRSGVLFPEAVEAFLRWCGEEKEFAAWGTGDFKVLRQNAERWELDCAFPEETLNLQAAFSHTLHAGRQIALYKAVEYCRIPDSFTFHNALNDAMYTALVAGFVTAEAVELARKSSKASRRAQVRKAGRTGPFESWAQALNSPADRHPACPKCGKRCGVGQWFYHTPETCYAMFRCGAHGRFVCKLELEREEEGWLGRLSVAPMTREAGKEYLDAKRDKAFRCAVTAQKRTPYRRKKKGSAR